MSVLKPRTRLVYFRVSEDEFERFNKVCADGGEARSISDLARQAVHQMVDRKSRHPLEEQVVELNQLVQKLTETIAAFQTTLQKVQPLVKE
jgi:hypothetical protein